MTTAYPLQWPAAWPRCAKRKRAKFSTKSRSYSTSGGGSWLNSKELTIAEATKRVLDELGRFGVPYGEAIISTNLELRLDGLPRGNQPAPTDPGVAVYWRRPNEQMKVMAIDIYDRVADNLGAVAATLDAMRAIERHGGAQILERAFTGFAALPPPDAFDPWAVLGLHPGATRDAIDAAFRAQSKKHHPDIPGGDHHAFQRIERARREALASHA